MAGRWWQARGKLEGDDTSYPVSAAAKTACLTTARAAWQCLKTLLVRLTANRAYKVSQIFGRVSDHCVPDGAFKCLLKKYPALSVRAPFSGAGPGPMNEAKLIARNYSSFTEGGGGSRTWENRIHFSVLKSRITGMMFPAYLHVLLVTCSLQKKSVLCVFCFWFFFFHFFLVKLCTRVVFLFLRHAWT